jgi:hypothetical protein
MGWVVKSLRGEALAAAGASGLMRDAERDARRIRRAAARDAGQTLAALAALETLGLEARERVRAERRALRTRAAGPVVGPAATTAPEPSPPLVVRAAAPGVRAAAPGVRAAAPGVRGAGPMRRRGRASLRESPVVELFRRT